MKRVHRGAAFVVFLITASCATKPVLVRASFDAKSVTMKPSHAWTDLRADAFSLCARDASGAFACAQVDAHSSHFRLTPYVVPSVAVKAIAVAEPAWLERNDGSVIVLHLKTDDAPKIDEVPWFHGALAIEATSFEFPPHTDDTFHVATLACARMPENEIRCTMPTTPALPPEQLSILLPNSAVSVGYKFACAITATRTRSVMCWGLDSKGQLGDGTRRSSDAAVQVRDLGDVVQVDAFASSACAVRSDGRVACWGHTNWDDEDHDAPYFIPALTNVVEVSLGSDFLCARLKSGSISCFGKNDRGQLGGGADSDDIGVSTIEGLGGVVKLVSLGDATCALRADHSIVCWGRHVAPETISL